MAAKVKVTDVVRRQKGQGGRRTKQSRDITKTAAKRKSAAKRVMAKKSRPVEEISTRKRNFRCKQVYHVFQRGSFRKQVFVSDEERAVYLNYFFQLARRHHVRVHNFCLMNNHVHFVLEQTRKHGISRLMRDLQGGHTRKQNARLKTFGNLWNQHYGCKHVVSESYYQALMWYVSNNPVKAGFRKAIEEYRWCGAKALVEGGSYAMQVPGGDGKMHTVRIALWTERFFQNWTTKTWRRIQAEPLSPALQNQLVTIELILDGTARLFFANQVRVQRLNEERARMKEPRGKFGGKPVRSAAGSAKKAEGDREVETKAAGSA